LYSPNCKRYYPLLM